MQFVRRDPATPNRLGILAGSFNPPTKAHLALIDAAAGRVDQVVCVLPRVFPHKLYHGATLEQRVRMLEAIPPRALPTSIAISEGGLFIEIARELHEIYGPQPEFWFISGRDAAERIVEWDYGEPGAIDRMFEEFSLLVASRQGDYEPPEPLSAHFMRLPVRENLDEISSTSVRQAFEKGDPWEHLVPKSIIPLVRECYGAR
jgi:nicotinate-nucleotide adenylyltransferase